MSGEFRTDEQFALALDEADPLAVFRKRFHCPTLDDGRRAVYFAGNSLGLQPAGVTEAVGRELHDWARLGVDGHFAGTTPWYSYHEIFREPLARLVGAESDEVVLMNGLTVNLHLMFVSFYRPDRRRYKILMEDTAFPSDTYAVKSQIRFHGYDPSDALIVAGRSEDLEELLRARGEEIALVMLSGVNYYTGRAFDLERVARCARVQGCTVGYDLAHAVGNLPLQLHDWDVDFAVWCSYKYLNGGPGAVAGCFVHRRHLDKEDLPRFAGWWGSDPDRRFRMHLEPEFLPVARADAWQLSNPPILAMAPLRVSLELFDEAGMEPLREKSIRLTRYLEAWVDHAGAGDLEVVTPREEAARGCQLSLRAARSSEKLFESLREAGVVADFRKPDVIRVAPVPLYNSFHDVWRFGRAVDRWSGRR